ncbi:UDP:flavonoid glycosyltransferase YjiC, YdhE family [Agromyces sp. CF514]|uniref:glycosyltransferase n=1 Tax=Agromyces sp. CF514 TaxID=1881031 RepID=UPI0008EEAEF6|nr:nucleotide disphospho-sugar-binding domain-containing protein [Agromyces sp. CF514]SFR70559.1 UDP:flavonoid glycosyltransferase YjiC, YdhE family [Agromyces sp. CF514]
MATVLFVPVTFNLAETTRMIEVARALAPEHRAVFMAYEHEYVHLIEAAGFEYRACEPAWSAAERQQAIDFDQGRAMRSPFTRELVAARVEVERRMIRATDASAVVIGSNITSLISARAEGVPLFYPVPFALTGPQVAQTRRMHLIAGSGRVARLADLVATRAFRWLYTRAPVAPRAFSSVAKANGVPPLRTVASMLEADVNLLTVMPWELDGYGLPDDYRRVGPIFARLDGELPAIVAELAAAPEPLVYLGLGSSADRALALAAAEQLGRLPVNVVAPIGHYLEPGDVVPPNVHVTDLLPAHLLGGLVDAAVLHGGQGTVQTACATGIPFVGLGLQPEQTWNVEVCVAQGNALRVPPKHVGRPEFLDAVRRVLADPAMRAAAVRVQRAFADEDGAAASARIIEAATSRTD